MPRTFNSHDEIITPHPNGVNGKEKGGLEANPPYAFRPHHKWWATTAIIIYAA
jgi:hypothetical protein